MCHEVRAISALEHVRTIHEDKDVEIVRMFTALTTGPGIVFLPCSCSDYFEFWIEEPNVCCSQQVFVGIA